MKMSNMKNLAALIIFLVFAVMLFAAPVAALVAPTSDELTVRINGSGLELEGLAISETEFRFYHLPEADNFDQLLLQIRNSANENTYLEYGELDASGNVVFPMRYFVAGDYQLRLWSFCFCADGKTQYELLTTVAMTKTSDGWALKNNRGYEHNKKLAAQEYAGQEAREWYLKPSDNIQSDDPRIIELAQEITENINDNYKKALAIHDWVTSNVSYNYDYINGNKTIVSVSALQVLEDRGTICSGYANLSVALLRAAGVPAKVILGYAKSDALEDTYPDSVFSEEMQINHAWLEFFADGHWVVEDPTWDCGNAIVDDAVTQRLGCLNHKYFDPGAEWFAQTHVAVKVSNVNIYTIYIDYDKMYYRNNGTWLDYSTDGASPYLEDSRTMIPLVSAIQMLGGMVAWKEYSDPQIVTLSCRTPEHSVSMILNFPTFFVDVNEYSFSNVPELVDGHVRVEARTLFSALGCDVNWDGYGEWVHGGVTVTFETLIQP